MAILLAGALTGVLVVCAIAGLFILRNASGDPTQLAPGTNHQAAPSGAEDGGFVPLEGPPDACSVLADAPEKLVPGGEPTPASATDTDTSVRCTWGDVGLGDDPRELSLELRSVPGADPVADAEGMFTEEHESDKSGDNLLPSQRLRDFDDLDEVGDQAYVLYFTETAFSQAVVNARVGNVLVTVSYGGSKDDDTPLDQGDCVDGATEAATKAIEAIKKMGSA
ncbi:hypothetical protein EDD29_9011 [Actinocorallia herbida]|uniref:DUF3558 domain-containing protein n=1 Tax=Actinocorallia herbida TaxID=58109 RepID=A0A3N1DDK0_9ACTN|nr:hypothetical protein [Actinocorallia herbida]ROO91258.1 hypothetical protein EDD29_9011 [Actinocorallia herbida]